LSKLVAFRIRDEEVWWRFKDFVLKKHGKLHTALSEEITRALKEYLDKQTCTHTHFSTSKHTRKLKKEIETIKEEILKRVEAGGTLHQNMLESMVREVSKVINGRSIKNRINTLIADGFLKHDWEKSMDGKIFKVIGYETNEPT